MRIRLDHSFQDHAFEEAAFVFQVHFVPGLVSDDVGRENDFLPAVRIGRLVQKIRFLQMKDGRRRIRGNDADG